MTISTTDILADFEQLTAPAQPQLSLTDFRDWLKSQHLSPASIRNYLSDTSQFAEWIEKSRRRQANKRAARPPALRASVAGEAGPHPDLDRVGTEHPRQVRRASLEPSDFTNYLSHLNSLNTPRSTINRRLASLRQLAKFLNLDLKLTNVPQPLIDNLLKNFHYYLRSHRHSSRTITNYLSDIRRYLNWATNNNSHSIVTHSHTVVTRSDHE